VGAQGARLIEGLHFLTAIHVSSGSKQDEFQIVDPLKMGV